MKSGTFADYRVALTNAIPGAISRASPGHGTVVDVPCKHCGTVETAFQSTGRMPPQFIRKALLQRGWQLGKNERRHICPIEHEKDPLAMADVITLKIPTTPPAPTPSVDLRKAKRDALEWLELSFDTVSGRFKEGVSDTTIGKETGLAKEAVAELREQFYGPLKQPAEVEQIRIEIGKLSDQAARINQEATDKIGALAKDIGNLSLRLEALVTKNGW